MPIIQQYTEESDEDEEKSVKFCLNEKKIGEAMSNNDLKNFEKEETLNHEDIKMDILLDTVKIHSLEPSLKGKIILLILLNNNIRNQNNQKIPYYKC